MATDDQSDDPMTEVSTDSADAQGDSPSPEVTKAEDSAKAPASPSARPVRVAPLRRRAKAKAKPAVPTGDAGEEPTPKRTPTVKSGSSFVTVDRTDPATAAIGIGVGLLVVALVVASVLLAIGGYRAQQREDLRAEYDSFAQQVTVNLTSLNKSNVDGIRKTLLEKTSGTAAENLQMVTQQIITQIEQHGIQTQGQVLSSAVTKAEPDFGQVLMVLGWSQREGNAASEVESQVFRWRVEMRRINDQLKLTKFDWVY